MKNFIPKRHVKKVITDGQQAKDVDVSRVLRAGHYRGNHMVEGFQKFLKDRFTWVIWQRALDKWYTPVKVFSDLSYDQWITGPVSWHLVPNTWGGLQKDWMKEAKRLAMECLLLKEDV